MSNKIRDEIAYPLPNLDYGWDKLVDIFSASEIDSRGTFYSHGLTSNP